MLRSRFVGRLIFLGIAVALLAGIRATAATPATMTIESASPAASPGSKGGKVNKQPKGGVPEDQIELLSVSRPGADATGDAASGAGRKTSGTGSGSSLIVTKAYDASSAQLEEAESTNEFLHQVTITFEGFAPSNGKGSVTGSSTKKNKTGQTNNADAAGQTSKTAEVLVLKNAQITLIEQTRNIQKISIEYQSIEVTYTSGKTAAATDDWETP
jgi:type VI protein secretion system component Hcp